jgi:two-component system, cell cycle sensor histidine kinase and response regulator CckA
MATKENPGKGVETARERFSQLYQRFRTSPTEQALLPEALQQLSNSVEELTVTTEELRRQNDELASTRSLVEAEREHYKELFEFAPDGYIVTDPHGIIREINSSAAKLLGVRWIRDVTERRATEQQVETQLKRISVLRDINLAITSILDL